MPARSSSGEQQAADVGLRLRLTWLSVARAVSASVLLVFSAARLLRLPPDEAQGARELLSFFFLGVAYLLTLVYGVVLRGKTVAPRFAYLQVAGDVALAAVLVYLTGGPDSPFVFVFLVVEVASALVLGPSGALWACGLGIAAFTLTTLLAQFGVLNPEGSPLSGERLVVALLTNGGAQLVMAVLAGFLASQLQKAGGRLQAREEDLRKLLELQNLIVEAIPSGLVTCDAEGRITYANHAAAAILELPRDQWQGRPVDEVVPGATALPPGTRRAEVTVATPRGERHLGLAVVTLGGAPSGRLIVFQDLTELRQVEGQLRQADRLATIGRFAAQLAHEIRNPLASMRGSAQMLASQAAPPREGRETPVPQPGSSATLANILIRESDRLSALLEDFLKLTRPQPPRPELVHLDALCRETLEMVRADPLARRAKLTEALEPAQAWADPAQIRQVLLNLVRNGLAAVPEGGTVRVATRALDERAELVVWDSAGAIPAADLDRIFEPFYTTRPGGTGLGLSTAHSIISAHGGSIRVRSDAQGGTEFRVWLPRRARQEAAA